MEFSVRQSLAWMMLSQGGLFLLQFGGSVAMARLLTPYEMGIYAVASAIVGILGAIRATGLNVFLIREPDLEPHVLATSFTINAILAMVTAAAIAALGSASDAILGNTGVRHVLLLLALSPLLSIFELLPAASLERIGVFRVLALVNLAKVTVSTTVTIFLAVNGFSYMSIAWGSLAGTLCGMICLNVLGRQYVSLRLSLKDWRRITRFGLEMFAVGVVGNLATKLSDLPSRATRGGERTRTLFARLRIEWSAMGEFPSNHCAHRFRGFLRATSPVHASTRELPEDRCHDHRLALACLRGHGRACWPGHPEHIWPGLDRRRGSAFFAVVVRAHYDIGNHGRRNLCRFG
jgi:hypothetical protein